ncbi:MAG: hypothetical protein QXN52_08735 [Nitrososphaerota archaeon]
MYIFILSTIVFIIGIVEDLYRSVPPYLRFTTIGFVSLVSTLVLEEIIINDLGIIKLSTYLGQIFTIFALTGITNAFNIIDGVNGLSSLLSIISLFFINLALKEGEVTLFDLNFIKTFISIASAFFIINITTKKIFLGDGGAYLTGFLIGIILTHTSNMNPYISPWFFLNIVSYPVVDTLFSMWRRKFLQKKGIMQSDLLHFHTLLCKKLIKSHTNTTLLIVFFSTLFSTISYLFKENTIILILVFISFLIIYSQSYFYIIRKFSKNFNKI